MVLLWDLKVNLSFVCLRRQQVLHGGENDILWLQRDFHIYLVNVFDTEKACQVTRTLLHSFTPEIVVCRDFL